MSGPVYGTPFTLALVESKLAGRTITNRGARLTPVRPRERVTVGAFTIEFLRVTHSIPDCVALSIETPHGVVIHTGDFKIDQTPIDGEGVDVHRLAQLGAAGVLALLVRQHQRRSPRVHRDPKSTSPMRFEEIFTNADRQDCRRHVRLEHLSDADSSSTSRPSSTGASRSSAAG